jgi:hypothetical protein
MLKLDLHPLKSRTPVDIRVSPLLGLGLIKPLGLQALQVEGLPLIETQ